MKRVGLKSRILLGIRVGALALMGGVFLVPLFWMIGTSLKTALETQSLPVHLFPKAAQWDNYRSAMAAFPFTAYLWNTTWLSALRVFGTILTAAMAAYAFTKLHWRGRDATFYVTLATMFIPAQVLIVPTYLIFTKLGMVNTYWPLVLPTFLGGGAFGIFLLRQFFVSIPDELLESGRIDGASEPLMFARIVLPMAVPALTTLGLFTFIFAWNDFMGPLIYLLDPSKWTLPIGLRAFQQKSDTQWNLLMAASTLTSLPLIVAYFFGQDYVTRGFTMREGIK
jgi:multiple sugar transport system permease protein